MRSARVTGLLGFFLLLAVGIAAHLNNSPYRTERLQHSPSVTPSRRTSDQLASDRQRSSHRTAALGRKAIPAELHKLEKQLLSFEANTGQTNSRVVFTSRTSKYAFFLTRDGAVLDLTNSSASRQMLGEEASLISLSRMRPRKIETPRRAVLEWQIVGASAEAKAAPSQILPGVSNYFLGNNPNKWRTNVKRYGRVTLEDVLPGIDFTYYGQSRELEYDILVHPGIDPGTVRIAFKGQRKLRVTRDGDLIVEIAGSALRLPKPVAYQLSSNSLPSKRRVDVHYILKGDDVVGFQVQGRDQAKSLVIDPVISYSSFLGGSSFDNGNGITVDSAGNAYLTGETSSLDFPLTPGAYQQSNAGGSDVFVAKFDVTGNLVYSTYLGGELSERGSSIAVDANGNACVTGRTNSIGFPLMNAWQSQLLGDFDAFVTELNSQGNALLFSTYLGGSGNDEGSGIAVDSSGSIYVTGGTSSLSGDDFPTTSGAFQRLFGGGNNDAFVTKFDPTQVGSGTLVYSTFLGGGGIDRGNSIAVDSAGNAYVTGRTASNDFPLSGAPQLAYAGGTYDAFVTELNSTGSSVVFSTFLGGSGTDQGYGIALDSSNAIYVTGVTDSLDFPTANAYQQTNAGANDVFLTKFAPGGSSVVYSSYFGGSASDSGSGLAVDSSGIAYVTGRTASAADFPVTADAIQPSFGGGPNDAFLVKIDPSQSGGASLVYSSYLGGSSDENIPSSGAAGNPSGGVAVDGSWNAYITGSTSSPDFPTATSFQAAYGGGASDAFVTQIAFGQTSSGSFSVGINLDSQTVLPGGGASYTITVFPSRGFTGSVGLTASGLPNNATASFSPAMISITDTTPRTATMSISTDPATPEGAYQLTIVATMNAVQSSTSTVLNVSSPSGSADLSLMTTGSPNPVTVNATLTYSLNVRNNGPGTATGVTVSDPLPQNFNAIGVSSKRGSCSQAAVVTCNIGILGAGEGAAITITGTPTSLGQIENTAQVSSDQSDPDNSNNSATASNLVQSPGTGSPMMLDSMLTVTAVITGLNEPTGIAFLGLNDFLVIEKSPRSGSADANILRVTNGVASTVLQLPVNSAVERGLLGIALHPNFPATPYIYLYWTCRGPEAGDHCDAAVGTATDVSKVPLLGNRVDRFIWNGTTLTFDRNLIVLHSYQADEGQSLRANHNGGKIAFGPDGKLYILIGDNGRRGNLQNVQFGTFSDGIHDDQFGGPDPDNNHLTGVILRLNDDGTMPADNPFFATGANLGGEDGINIQRIYAYGVRNSFGMAFDPMSGNLWNEENGDDSFDEINMIPPGANNGWVQIMGPASRIADFKSIETSPAYFGLQQIRWSPTLIADTPDAALGSLFMLDGATYNDPRFSWKYAVAPSPIGFAGSALGSYAGDLFVGAARTFLEGGYLFHFKLTADRTDLDLTQDGRLADRVADNTDKFDITESESLLIGRDFGITSDIQTGPDGNLFVVSLSNSAGAASSGAVYEVSLSPSACTAAKQ